MIFGQFQPFKFFRLRGLEKQSLSAIVIKIQGNKNGKHTCTLNVEIIDCMRLCNAVVEDQKKQFFRGMVLRIEPRPTVLEGENTSLGNKEDSPQKKRRRLKRKDDLAHSVFDCFDDQPQCCLGACCGHLVFSNVVPKFLHDFVVSTG